MKTLITGSNGQLGHCLQNILPADKFDIRAHDIDSLDLTDTAAVRACFSEFKPELVINAAAYTAVDKAEQDVDLADAINHRVAAELASQCRDHQARLIHISTDFVFNGQQSTPYLPGDITQPINVYGRSKRDGELAISRELPDNSLIIRTAWLYSAYGNNFVKTMLRLMSEKSELNIIADQIGTPTSANSLARLIHSAALNSQTNGLYHWTDAGVASWYDFAVAIYEEALQMGLLTKSISINPIPTRAYPTPATRPSFSLLDKTQTYADFAMPSIHWREELRQVLNELATLENH